jgi:hypothetical protein
VDAAGQYEQPVTASLITLLTFTAAAGPNRFSLADEARFTSGHRSTAFDAGKKLRHLPISFVSAGCLEGTIKDQVAEPVEPAPATSSAPDVNQDAFAHMTIRSPSRSLSVSSLVSSASSEEVVVFRGRGHADTLVKATSPMPVAPTSVTPASVASTPAVLGESATPLLTAATFMDKTSPKLTGPSSDEQNLPYRGREVAQETVLSFSAQDNSEVDSDTNSINDTPFEKRRGGKPIWEGKTTEWTSRSKPGIGWLPVQDRPDMDQFLRGDVDPRKAAMDDYMQNMEAFGLTEDLMASASFSRREMDLDGGSHNDWRPDQSQEGEPEVDVMNGWDSDMLRDLDDISTSSDLEAPVVRILKKRFRAAGLLQYLILYEDRLPDDARWVPASYLKTPTERKLIQDFENDLLSRPQPSDSESDSEFAYHEEGEQSDEESDDDELDDETIARVLQKQEELGLGSEEMLLYAHDEYFRGSSLGVSSFDRPSKRRQHRTDGGSSFPSAAAMADALDMDPYGAFDIMDTERPSLRPVKKGRRGHLPPELDDSDLNDQIQAAWGADRAKKRLKKAEREELRKQGLLGRNGKAADLSVKYKDGVDMMGVVEDIRDFMSSDKQSLSLPPMEASRRALIHQFVSSFGLTSKSRGDGPGRFTVLSKTRRAVIIDDDAFDALIEAPRFKRRLLGSYPPRPGPKGPRGKIARPSVGYKDGDVVGASAPELGPENRGRALMEKMGWSKGMALGAHDNKGILHPIAHTVKTNKAGLQ